MYQFVDEARTRVSEIDNRTNEAVATVQNLAAAEIQGITSASATERESVLTMLDERIARERTEHPTLNGSLEAVLPHHFGRDAIKNEIERAFRLLSDKIIAAWATESSAFIPVLFEYQVELGEVDENDPPLSKCALVLVAQELAQTPFRSTYSVGSEKLHAFMPGKEVEVEHVNLFIVGASVEALGDIFSIRSRGVKADQFSMRSQSIAKGGEREGLQGTYSSHDRYEDCMNYEDPVRNFSVGWSGIQARIERRGSFEHTRLEAYHNLYQLLRALNCTDFGPAKSNIHRALTGIAMTENAASQVDSAELETVDSNAG